MVIGMHQVYVFSNNIWNLIIAIIFEFLLNSGAPNFFFLAKQSANGLSYKAAGQGNTLPG
jgi:hypothetical protein